MTAPTIDQLVAATAARLIDAMETGAADPAGWRAPWHGAGMSWIPTNALTGNGYSGVNVMVLTLTAGERNYTSNVWATFKQWQALGHSVQKGERATYGVKWIVKDETDATRRRSFPVTFALFNIAQTDAPMPIADEPAPRFGRVYPMEEWITATGATIREGGNRAYFDRVADSIALPPFDTFHTADDYYATAAHELVHWTGAESRLARTFGARFGDDAYAAEELVAELGAASIMAAASLSSQPRPDHAHYVAHWCRVLRAEPRILMITASAASAAVSSLPTVPTATRESAEVSS